MARSRFAPGLLLALSLVWGSSWIANGMLAELASPLRTIFLRYLLASACLALACGYRHFSLHLRRAPQVHPSSMQPVGRQSPAINEDRSAPDGHLASVPSRRSAWLTVSVLLGCTMFALPDLLMVWGAEHGVAHFAPLIYAALPLGLLLAAGDLRQPAIVAIGAMLFLLNGSLPLNGNRLAWTLLIVLAVSLQGWSLVYARRHLAIAASLEGVLVQLSAAALVLGIALDLWPDPSAQTPLRGWPAPSVGALLMLAAPATAVAYPLYYRLLTWLEPAQLAATFWLQVLVALGESAWLLRIRPGWTMSTAGVVLIACSVLMLREEAPDSQPDLGFSSRAK